MQFNFIGFLPSFVICIAVLSILEMAYTNAWKLFSCHSGSNMALPQWSPRGDIALLH